MWVVKGSQPARTPARRCCGRPAGPFACFPRCRPGSTPALHLSSSYMCLSSSQTPPAVSAHSPQSWAASGNAPPRPTAGQRRLRHGPRTGRAARTRAKRGGWGPGEDRWRLEPAGQMGRHPHSAVQGRGDRKGVVCSPEDQHTPAPALTPLWAESAPQLPPPTSGLLTLPCSSPHQTR